MSRQIRKGQPISFRPDLDNLPILNRSRDMSDFINQSIREKTEREKSKIEIWKSANKQRRRLAIRMSKLTEILDRVEEQFTDEEKEQIKNASYQAQTEAINKEFLSILEEKD